MKRRMILAGSLGTLALAAGLGAFFWQASPSAATPEAADEPVEHPLQLQVPLDQTVDERAQVVAELKAARTTNLLPIYEKWIDTVGANGLIAAVEEWNPTCHDEAHDLGKEIYKKIGDVGEALATCEDACYSGCMHGVIMQVFTEGETAPDGSAPMLPEEHVQIEDAKARIATICDKTVATGLYKAGDCAHGIGHGLMYLAEYDIPKALAVCDTFDSYPMRYYCATGAYMEFVERGPKEVPPGATEFYPCDVSPYPAACFRYEMTHVVADHYKETSGFHDLVLACEAMTGNVRLGCFHGLGNANMPYVRGGSATLEQVCHYGEHDDQYVCIEGVMERFEKYYPDEAPAACDSVDGWQKDLCEEAVAHGMYDITKSFDLYQR